MFIVWSSVKNDPTRTDITPEKVAFLEKASGVIGKPDPQFRLQWRSIEATK